jgi:hypothetical protein
MTEYYKVELSGDEYRAMARQRSERAEESFERCDTDGFLSQWALNSHAEIYRKLAQLADNGGMADVLFLCDLETERILDAKVVQGRFGLCWLIDGSEYGEDRPRFASYCPARESTLAKRGLKEKYIEVPVVLAVQYGSNYQPMFSYEETLEHKKQRLGD